MRTYPENRRYTWAAPAVDHTYAQARAIFKALASAKGGAQRGATLKDMLGAIDYLYAKGTRIFPGQKMQELFIRLAHVNLWFVTDQSVRRAGVPQHIPDGKRVCAACLSIKDSADFVSRATPAQCRAYGWKYNSKRRILCNTCEACRRRGQQRERQRDLRARAKDSDQHPVLALHARVEGRITDTRRALKDAHPLTNAIILDFYHLRLRALLAAREILADDSFGQVVNADDWTVLLSKSEREALKEAFAKAAAYPRLGRPITNL